MKNSSISHFGLNHDKKVILLIGGSLGARTLNDSIMGGLEKIGQSDVQLLWQCGNYYHEEANKALRESGVKNVKLLPFIKEMNKAFQAADLIISRAGAGTISELCIIGKAVILVPSPNVAEDHQTSNARALTDQQAAVMVTDNDARKALVDTALQVVNDDVRKKILSANISKLAIRDSAERIANEIRKLV